MNNVEHGGMFVDFSNRQSERIKTEQDTIADTELTVVSPSSTVQLL